LATGHTSLRIAWVFLNETFIYFASSLYGSLYNSPTCCFALLDMIAGKQGNWFLSSLSVFTHSWP